MELALYELRDDFDPLRRGRGCPTAGLAGHTSGGATPAARARRSIGTLAPADAHVRLARDA